MWTCPCGEESYGPMKSMSDAEAKALGRSVKYKGCFRCHNNKGDWMIYDDVIEEFCCHKCFCKPDRKLKRKK